MTIDACKAALAGLEIDDNPATVRQKSRDFFWYSPVLKTRLHDVCGDFVVTPKDALELRRALAAAYAHDTPVTVRGAGTGNYGQAMPLAGGMVLHMKHLDQVLEIAPGRLRAQGGAMLAQVERQARETGQELRLHPSTLNTATLGGFIAGGSGGVGSIRWGGLRDPGNILSLTLLSCEAEPREVILRGSEIARASHAYGVNGVITEIEIPLAPAYAWMDLIWGFDDWEAANRAALALARCDGVLLKELATVEAPAPHAYFLRHRDHLAPTEHVVIATAAAHAVEATEQVMARAPGALRFRSDRDSARGQPPGFELGWNHTTLRALKVDPEITYLQTLYAKDPPAQAAEMSRRFANELIGHVEYIRMDGRVVGAGLPMVRFTDEARLDALIAAHEAAGIPVFNPHRYTLEEGGMKAPEQAQLDFKRACDPKGLMNPGKMIAWDHPDHDFSAQGIWLFPGLSD